MSPKKCTRCHMIKPILEFNCESRSKDGHNSWCRSCVSEFNKKWRLKHLDEKRRYHREYHRRTRAQYRDEVFRIYGPSCLCCGERNRRFLTIDHVNGDGKIGRRRKRSHDLMLLRKLAKHGQVDPEFQILCYNCNIGKYLNKGICPHRETP